MILVLISPELALSPEFTMDVLGNTPFMRRLGLLVIDELHLMDQWSNFQSQYGQLYVLRIRIGLDIPGLGLIATLSKDMLPSIQAYGGFKGNVRIIRLDMIDLISLFRWKPCNIPRMGWRICIEFFRINIHIHNVYPKRSSISMKSS